VVLSGSQQIFFPTHTTQARHRHWPTSLLFPMFLDLTEHFATHRNSFPHLPNFKPKPEQLWQRWKRAAMPSTRLRHCGVGNSTASIRPRLGALESSKRRIPSTRAPLDR
jgi:hypothetical protein